MKYHKVILGLLALLLVTILCLSIINCVNRSKSIKRSLSSDVITFSKYDVIIIENIRLRSDEEFKVLVERQVRNTGYINICYDTVVRLHKTYLIRAWVFYKKEKE